MQFFWTEPFRRDFRHLPLEIKKKLPDALRHFSAHPRYPVLHVKKMEGTADIWEMRLSDSYRLTFQFVKEGVLLRRIGTHDILRTP